MKSFNELYTELQDQSGDDSDAQLTIFKRHINDTQRMVLGDHSWKFLEKTRDIETEADTQRYELPADLRKVISLVTLDANGEVDQLPQAVEDPDFWEWLNWRNTTTSDITQYYYQEGNDVLLWPTFSTAALNLRVRYRKRVIEMSRADYSTGTISDATSGSKTITGASTVFTGREPLGNQWMRLAQPTGDYRWYEVGAIASDTELTLDKNYLGTTFSAASLGYTLGEMPTIPGEYHNILFARPMALYYMKLENTAMANTYWKMYDGGYELGNIRKPLGILGKFIKEQAGMLDAKYFPNQRSSEVFSSEFLAKDTQSTLG